MIFDEIKIVFYQFKQHEIIVEVVDSKSTHDKQFPFAHSFS